jgi:hypothetical protein
MYEFDLYFPVVSGNGVPNRPELFQRTKERLAGFFGGLTDFRHRNSGTWVYGGVAYRDEVVLLRALGQDRTASRDFLHSVGRDLAAELGEQTILIVEREIFVLA